MAIRAHFLFVACRIHIGLLHALHSLDTETRSKLNAYGIELTKSFRMADNVVEASTTIYTTIKSKLVTVDGYY